MSWRAIGMALVLGAAGVAAAPAGGHGALACGPPAAPTMAADGQARVYESHGVFGCAQGHPSPVKLGGSPTSCLGAVRIGPVALAGATAAYAAERCGIDTGSTTVEVRRLTDGRELASASAGAQPGPESYTTVTRIVVRTDGAAAWISVSSSLGIKQSRTEVWGLSRHSLRRFAASASGSIAAHSLRLHGRRLSWRQDGRLRSATLG